MVPPDLTPNKVLASPARWARVIPPGHPPAPPSKGESSIFIGRGAAWRHGNSVENPLSGGERRLQPSGWVLPVWNHPPLHPSIGGEHGRDARATLHGHLAHANVQSPDPSIGRESFSSSVVARGGMTTPLKTQVALRFQLIIK